MKAQDYSRLISPNNLFQAWREFKKGKSKKKDVQFFERKLEDNLFSLYEGLNDKTYQHGDYESFFVCDPKKRHIHKASVQDRVVHHLLYKFLYNLFDPAFIYDSYSCRLDKGTHKGVARLEKFTRVVSKNYTLPCCALKCDIKKFFATIDHGLLLALLKRKIKDPDIFWLIQVVINSFHSEFGKSKGIPLGNLTSQVFANIYLNELDQFVKAKLRVKHYIRYADDFLFLDQDPEKLNGYLAEVDRFLHNELKLELHPRKVILRKFNQGIDFLGYVVLPHHRLARTKTRKRIFKKLESKVASYKTGRIDASSLNQSIQSYLGVLGHANTYEVTQKLKNEVWIKSS